MNPSFQDWAPVILKKTVNGVPVKKPSTAKHISSAAQTASALEKSALPKAPKMLSSLSRTNLIAKRIAAGLNQKQLDQRCSFPAHTINGFESGNLTPSGGQLNILNRLLGTALRLE
jgi:ribosome-binding protein aMBF1 (putative translation factor)